MNFDQVSTDSLGTTEIENQFEINHEILTIFLNSFIEFL